jgi:hypothetical protein
MRLSWKNDVKRMARRLAVLASRRAGRAKQTQLTSQGRGSRGIRVSKVSLWLITCLVAMTWACSSRRPATAGPVQAPADPPPDTTTVIEVPAPPPLPPPPVDIPSETRSDDCAVIAAPGDPIATVALNERVNPSNAPHPTNDSERLLFRQLYDTLIRADCLGRAVPGLATSWRLDADGGTWVVTLSEDARFADGSPLTAADVPAGWTRNGLGGQFRAEVDRLVQSVAIIDDRTLAIRLRSQRAEPLALAHADLAVAKSVGGSAWPVGTRAARLVPTSEKPVRAESVFMVVRDNLPSIQFRVFPGDPRDLLDGGVDLLLTRDPAALDYAATLPQFQSLPLVWQRTYVLLTPGRSRLSPALSQEATQTLADDAVRGEARGAQGPFWWEMLTECELPGMAPLSQSPPAPRVVYDANDAAARDLAERFVGLARAAAPDASNMIDGLLPDRPRRTYQRAAGLTNEALALARRLGTDAGYIVAVNSRPLDGCRDMKALMENARWLDPQTVVPLVETRLHAVVRRGRSGLTSEWDGGLVLAGVKAPN